MYIDKAKSKSKDILFGLYFVITDEINTVPTITKLSNVATERSSSNSKNYRTKYLKNLKKKAAKLILVKVVSFLDIIRSDTLQEGKIVDYFHQA